MCRTCSRASLAAAAGHPQPSPHRSRRFMAMARFQLGASSCRASTRAQLAAAAARVALALIGAVPRRRFPSSGTPSAVLARAAARHQCRRIGPARGTGQSRHGASSFRATSRGRHAVAAVQGASARIGAVPRLRGPKSGTQSAAAALGTARRLLRRPRRGRTTRRTARSQLGAALSRRTTRRTLAAAAVRGASAWSGAAPHRLSPSSGTQSAVAASRAAHLPSRTARKRGWSQLGVSSCRATTRARLAEAPVQVASARIGAAPRRVCRSSGTQSAAVARVILPEEPCDARAFQQATLPLALHRHCCQR